MNIQAISSLNILGSGGGTQGTSSTGSASSSTSSAMYDIKDLNQDRIVSSYEEYIYSLTHYSKASSQNLLTQYNSNGELHTATHEIPTLINTYA